MTVQEEKPKEEIYEFTDQYSRHPILGKVIPWTTTIITFESSKLPIDIKKKEVVDKLYSLLFNVLPFKFGEEDKLKTILYVVDHPDFTETVYSSNFLDYVRKELINIRRNYLRDFFSKNRMERALHERNL